MAVLPIFVIGPSAVMALIGHIRGARPVQPADPAALRDLEIDVVIPAYNEEATIALCLASLMRQTIKPNTITVIDDGSRDDTAGVAEAFAAANDFAIRIIRRRRSIGKTPGLKIESRNLEGDVEFILDADTILISEDYIEKVVAQLYRVPGIASACGVVHSLRDADRLAVMEFDSIRRLRERRPELTFVPPRPTPNRLAHAVSNFYRDSIFQFLQVFFYSGLQKLFGTLPNPIGCAVAYRREYLREFFDHYEPAMGDNMTTSEDIFIGTAFMAQGYHNTQDLTVFARSEMPELQRVPRQLMKWSASWLQTGYYMPEMMVSPFKFFRRYRHQRRNRAAAQKRRIVDGYRQPFGLRFVEQLGRPSGWIIAIGLFEKLAFTLVILILVVLGLFLGVWWPLLLTVLLETLLFTGLLVGFSPQHRLEYAVKALTATPFRYVMMAVDGIVFTQFLVDMVFGRRSWRK